MFEVNEARCRCFLTQKSSELSDVPEGKVLPGREKLVRELSALEQGPLQELEKSVAEQKHTIAKASTVLEKLVSDARVVRLQMEASEKATKSAHEELKATQEKIHQVIGGGS